MATVLAPEKLRFVAFSHWEPDESGAQTSQRPTANLRNLARGSWSAP
jgi:hypothetical protein